MKKFYLEQQLKEKDEEIALNNLKIDSAKQTADYYRKLYNLKYEDIAKQICEKIRKVIDDDCLGMYLETYSHVIEVLDQIERGENNE